MANWKRLERKAARTLFSIALLSVSINMSPNLQAKSDPTPIEICEPKPVASDYATGDKYLHAMEEWKKRQREIPYRHRDRLCNTSIGKRKVYLNVFFKNPDYTDGSYVEMFLPGRYIPVFISPFKMCDRPSNALDEDYRKVEKVETNHYGKAAYTEPNSDTYYITAYVLGWGDLHGDDSDEDRAEWPVLFWKDIKLVKNRVKKGRVVSLDLTEENGKWIFFKDLSTTSRNCTRPIREQVRETWENLLHDQ